MPTIPTPKTPTLMDVLQGTPQNVERKTLEGVAFEAPLLEKLPAKVVPGTTYIQKVRTSVPLFGPVPYNTGVAPFKSSYETKNGQCFPYSGLFAIDKKLVMAEPQNAAAYMADEMRAGTRGLLIALEMSVIYGKAFHKDGAFGLVDTIGDYMTISATGKNQDRTHGGASVWAICANSDMLHTVWGTSKVVSFGAQREETLMRPTKDGGEGLMPSYVRDFVCHFGFAQLDEFATARIVNESETNKLTDALLAQLVNNFPAGHTPTMLVMNRATRARLQQSRAESFVYPKKTAGNTPYAELPTEFEGIPIVVTDALLADETQQAVAGLSKLNAVHALKNTNNLIR